MNLITGPKFHQGIPPECHYSTKTVWYYAVMSDDLYKNKKKRLDHDNFVLVVTLSRVLIKSLSLRESL